jgi:hypothetical protein
VERATKTQFTKNHFAMAIKTTCGWNSTYVPMKIPCFSVRGFECLVVYIEYQQIHSFQNYLSMNLFKKVLFPVFALCILSLSACSDDSFPYEQYDNNEVVTNDYTGNVMVTSGGTDPAADFTGNGDSGTYSFAWVNPQKRASLDFDITTNTGSVQMTLNDAEGTEVLNATRSAGGNDTYSGVSSAGVSGTWLVTLILTDFNGDGSYSLHPGD